MSYSEQQKTKRPRPAALTRLIQRRADENRLCRRAETVMPFRATVTSDCVFLLRMESEADASLVTVFFAERLARRVTFPERDLFVF